MTEPTRTTDQTTPNQVYVPKGWCQPTHQQGDIVWHQGFQYQVTEAAPNYFWGLWSYAVTPVGHDQEPDYMESVQGYLLEHQLGKESPTSCDEKTES